MVQGGTGEPSSKKIHPFFTKADAPVSLEDPASTDFSTSPPVTAGSESSVPETTNHDESRRKRRKTDAPPDQEGSGPKRQRRKRKGNGNSLTGAILNHLIKPQQPVTASATADENARKIPSPPLSEVSSKPDDHAAEIAESPAPDVLSENAPSTTKAAQPKKVLKFNPKTGKFGSPQRPKTTKAPSRLVCIKYGSDADNRKRIGGMITQILEGMTQLPLDPVETSDDAKREPTAAAATTTTTTTTTRATTTRTTTTSSKAKSAHPFFTKAMPDTGKADDPVSKPTINENTKIFLSTPVSPRKPRPVSIPTKALQFGRRSAGAKIPGAMHPMWPAQGMAHVRGEVRSRLGTTSEEMTPYRKSKGLTTIVAPDESLLRHVTKKLEIDAVRKSLVRDVSKIEPTPDTLRLPLKHFESGRKLRTRIRSQLTARFVEKPLYEDCDFSPDELSASSMSRAHPGLEWLYQSLETQLSAYDRSTCESAAWTQKYAPVNSKQVLQQGREAVFLRDWLQTLRVQSVESGSAGDDKDKDKDRTKLEGAPKKRRRKNKLEDFIVDDEADSDSMYEISDDEDDDSDHERGHRRRMRTIMRGGNLAAGPKNQKRLANSILLSGPHGCGKTATVYAVARELGFEVFEINSSSRRSGKDILEKVGDMTRNHLVQQNRADPASIDTDEVDDEVKSGKQGMMTAFFKPKEAKRENREAVPKTRGKKQQNDEGADRECRTTSGKAHKQSLILLEEVDILFEEDKQFWATLMGLIAQSKRPFIMTCNDEELVPIQSLSLHGIFRFSPVPSHLAADLCILIAANEGHALRRPAVEALYHSRGDDLRATITELNYWCQIGVGDRRGGFDWFYLRWPRGCDLDEDGDVVRVVSEDTFCEGMGWMSRDPIATAPGPLDAEEEAMRQAWDNWQCDAGDWSDTDGLRSWAAQVPQPAKPSSRRLSLLAAFDSFCSAMSDADLCASRAHGTQLLEVLDATLPEMPASRRDDFITGQALLDAHPLVHQASASKAISTTLRSLARETLYSPTAPSRGRPSSKPKTQTQTRALQPLDEHGATSILNRSFRDRPRPLVRYDLAVAFDPIAVAPKGAPATHLDPSVFDRPLLPIVLDVAPWVRGIVLHDQRLMQRRLRLSNLLSEGGAAVKRRRMRSTRSALSALEGGERHAMKRDRWFGDALGVKCVMATAGEGWTELVMGCEEGGSAGQSPASDELAGA